MKELNILVADTQDLFRLGARTVLESQEGWSVIEAVNGRDAIEKANRFHPRVAVLAMYMPSLNGTEAARRIVDSHPGTSALLIGETASEAAISQALRSGARGYITRSTAARDLIAAARRLANRGAFFNSDTSEFLRNKYLKTFKALQPRLTSRELEIVQLLSEGKSSKEIAALAGISPKTVETHRSRIMRKLEAHSVADVVRYAIRTHIIEA